MRNLTSIAAGLYLAIASIGLSTGPAHATLLGVSDRLGVFGGAEIVTLDDVNNLEWLDVTESTSRSFDDVAGQFGAGGDFAGWRHATRADLTALFTQAGFAPDFSGAAPDVAFTSFQALLGITLNKKGRLDTRGYYDDSLTGSDPAFVGDVRLETGTDLSITAIISDDGIGSDRVDGEFGSFLVRSAASEIAEPGSLVLFGLGLAGLGLARRRKKA